VLTNDGRVFVGTLKGFDQTTNIILQDGQERLFSTERGVESVSVGLYLIRGDNMHVPSQ
jgi:U6 snRNA-associated Sm-like protein LSm8